VDASQIEVFVPHQANLRIIERVRRAAGLDHAVTAEDVRVSGNTSAASIPMALVALREGHDLSGRLALLAGFGAGLTAGAQVVRLPG
jgi:3-oxoacyl-[acyl-carrier-protein] synthase-3